jgi:hypothetical protein
MMEVLEDRERWREAFRRGWLAHFEATGEFDWSMYKRPTNTQSPAGPAIDLAGAQLVLISTAGGYLPGEQDRFDAADPLGDYSIRRFPASTGLDRISFAHGHYDHSAVELDAEVLLPLRLLEEMRQEGRIGRISDSVISLMGYQPDVIRVLDEAVPAVVSAVKEQRADAALLVPS